MNKIVYSFWITSLKTYWKKRRIGTSFDSFIKSSIDCLTLSLLYAKKNGFTCEMVTDVETYHLLKELPFDKISTELTVIRNSEFSWVRGKIMTMLLQNEPFVHIHWDVLLKGSFVIDRIKKCTEDVLVLRMYEGNEFLNRHTDLIDYTMSLDMCSHFVMDFHTPYYKAFDCSVVGFNNLKLRDKYVADFFKCLDVADKNYDIRISSLIEQYLLFVITSREKASVQVLLNNDIRNHFYKKQYTQLLSLYKNTKAIQDHFKYTIQETFPKWNFLIRPKNKITNEIKISLCTVVMNRKSHLLRTLKNNIRVANSFKDIDINVLNYNSTDGLEEELFSKPWFVTALKSGKLKYYRNNTAKYFHRSLPKNKIHVISKGEYLINIDADNFVSKAYIKFCLYHINHNPKKFFIRSSLTGGSCGRILVARKDFDRLQGYNLKMKSYGFEDTDFCLRLKALGIHQILCPAHLCSDVIEHGDELRVINEYQSIHNKNANLLKQKSDAKNRSLGFQLYPNSKITMNCSVVSVNHDNQVIVNKA